MSIEAMTWALSADVGDPTRKLALVGWANHAHKDGRNAWASQATVAEYVGCSSKTIGRHVKVLLAEGWIREGDQGQVAHLRADRRPVVYDLAMTEHQRRAWSAEWAAEYDDDQGTDDAEDPAARVDDLSPRDDETGGQNVAPSEDDGWTHGGTSGGTPVSDKPYEPGNQEPPNPPHGGGRSAIDEPGPVAGCRRHRTPADNCRGCGTTNRQIAERREKEAAEQRRLDQAARFEAEGGAVRPSSQATPMPADLRDQVRGGRKSA